MLKDFLTSLTLAVLISAVILLILGFAFGVLEMDSKSWVLHVNEPTFGSSVTDTEPCTILKSIFG